MIFIKFKHLSCWNRNNLLRNHGVHRILSWFEAIYPAGMVCSGVIPIFKMGPLKGLEFLFPDYDPGLS